MNKQLLYPILLLVCGALLFLAAILPKGTTASDAFNDAGTRDQDAASTQLLWESLSRQFLTSVQY